LRTRLKKNPQRETRNPRMTREASITLSKNADCQRKKRFAFHGGKGARPIWRSGPEKGTILTTEGLISEKEEQQNAQTSREGVRMLGGKGGQVKKIPEIGSAAL